MQSSFEKVKILDKKYNINGKADNHAMQYRAFRNYNNLPKTLLILLNVCQISTIKKNFLTKYLLRVHSTNIYLMEKV